MSRKYKQHGYQDSGGEKPAKRERPDAPRGPRPEQIGPRTPRMVGTVMRARCANCGTVLQPGFDVNGTCPKCGLELHCCKQCVNFDTGALLECTQPIPERIAKKDARNDCAFYECRMTVEKDTAPAAHAPTTRVQADYTASAPRPTDARTAFDNLFKK
jgi:hypothetical protein